MVDTAILDKLSPEEIGHLLTRGGEILAEKRAVKAREHGAVIIEAVKSADAMVEEAVKELEGAPYLFCTVGETVDGQEIMSDAELVRGLIKMLNKGLEKKARTGNGGANGSDYVGASYTLEGTLLTVSVDGKPDATWTVPEDHEGKKNVSKAVRKHLAENGCETNNRTYQLRIALGVNGEGR